MPVVRAAAIDCGTNSIRLLIADVSTDDASAVEVARTLRIVRLGEGVDATGRFSVAALERTRLACGEFAEILTRAGAPPLRFVATSAARDAENSGEFVAMIQGALGVVPEIITGEEEGALSFLGATLGLPVGTPTPLLIVDIGGGSTEFVRGASDVEHRASVDIGCVRLTERHFHSDPPTDAQLTAAIHDIDAAIEQAAAVVPLIGVQTLVGVAGSVTTVAALSKGLARYDSNLIHGSSISAGDVESIAEDLLAMTMAERSELAVMVPGRADVIAAGALVLARIMIATGADAVLASERDILDGIVVGLARAQ